MIKINGFFFSRDLNTRGNEHFENCAENIVNFTIKIDDYGFKAISRQCLPRNHHFWCLQLTDWVKHLCGIAEIQNPLFAFGIQLFCASICDVGFISSSEVLERDCESRQLISYVNWGFKNENFRAINLTLDGSMHAIKPLSTGDMISLVSEVGGTSLAREVLSRALGSINHKIESEDFFVLSSIENWVREKWEIYDYFWHRCWRHAKRHS